jgi:hypothetical protein
MNASAVDRELEAPCKHIKGLDVPLVDVRAISGSGDQLLIDHVHVRKYRLHEAIAVFAPKALALTGTADDAVPARLGGEGVEFSPIGVLAACSCARQSGEALARSMDV